MKRRIGMALKIMTAVCIAILMMLTYANRAKVLELTRLRAAAEDIAAQQDIADFVESFESRKANYEMALEDYQQSMELYRTDYQAYTQSFMERGGRPMPPRMPVKPQPPEVTQRLAEINTTFRQQRHQYFKELEGTVGLAGLAATILTLCLITLLFMETGSARWAYAALLALCFTFLIGPAMYTMLAGIVGVTRAPVVPGLYDYYRYGY